MLLTTANVMNRPKMSQSKVIEDVMTAKRYATVIGWQEINPARYKTAIRYAGDGKWTHTRLETPTPISVNADYYEIAVSGHKILHHGRALASPARGFSWAVIRRKSDGTEFVLINTHFVSGAWNKKKKLFKAWRKKMWLKHWAGLQRAVKDFVAQGYTVLVVGDFNREKLPELHPRAQNHLENGIIKILTVHTKDTPHVRVVDTWGWQGHSDHPQKTARIRLRDAV